MVCWGVTWECKPWTSWRGEICNPRGQSARWRVVGRTGTRSHPNPSGEPGVCLMTRSRASGGFEPQSLAIRTRVQVSSQCEQWDTRRFRRRTIDHVCPSWEDLATGEVSASPEDDEDPNEPRAGWQSKAALKVEAKSLHVCWAPSRIRRKLCCVHKVDLSLQLRSSACQLTGCHALIPSLSGCYFCAVSISPYPSLFVLADVAVSLIALATIGLRGGVGSSWVSSGERGSTNLPRNRRKGQNECLRSRSRFARVQQRGRTETRSRR